MESLPTVLSRGTVCHRSDIDEAELSSWRRNGQWQHHHCYFDSQSNEHYEQQSFPELMSSDVDHSSSSVLQRMPKCGRKSSLPCTDVKGYVFHRSGSGSQLATARYMYAGARFNEAPSPKLLPLPPRRWLDGVSSQGPTVCGEMTRQLKSVLQVE